MIRLINSYVKNNVKCLNYFLNGNTNVPNNFRSELVYIRKFTDDHFDYLSDETIDLA